MDYKQILSAIIFILVMVAVIASIVAIINYLRKDDNRERLLKQLKTYISADGFKEDVHKIMVYAEHLIIGTEKGQERLRYVCGWINEQLPDFLQPVVTTEILIEFVEELFELYSVETEDGHIVVK